MDRSKALGHIVLVSILLVLILPFLVLIIWSFSQGWASNALLPNEFGLRGWRYLFSQQSRMLSSLGMSILISLVVTGFGMILSIPAGKALGLYIFPGKRLIELLVLAPTIIPTIAVGMGIQIAFIRYGLADTLLGVILVHLPLVLPYGIRIFASIYKALGTKWEDQAKILKANGWQRFWFTSLPFLYPGMISAGVLMFNVSFSQYFLTYLIGGGKIMTLPILLFPFVNSGDRVMASGLSLIFILSSLILMLIIERVITDSEEKTNVYYL
ncbi:ABC transporter permease [Desulfosporosinus shakirovi]|uniref:ABC transporter permease n=1 Tax=Desulfosporosinus shakirovi TaxID=2885154 RepID=UPI001E52C67C|nr:ABC transporter permease subunit [Desulfosporosinus sp. SRJS8]MCB8814820.1 ABC transporter permease subunit [Desulfosporosinus sp. SRJS8]